MQASTSFNSSKSILPAFGVIFLEVLQMHQASFFRKEKKRVSNILTKADFDEWAEYWGKYHWSSINQVYFQVNMYKNEQKVHITVIHVQGNHVHIGLVVRMSILDTKGRRFEPQHQFVFSLSKILYPHCFSQLSCEMSTRWGQPREGCSVLWAFRRNST